MKIEWHEEGKRRSRTIGENSPEVRRRADEALQEILEVFEPAAVPARRSLAVPPDSMEQALRALAVSVLDVADQMAESAMAVGSDLVHRIRRSRTAPEPELQDEAPEKAASPEE
ncbi:MAG: hypothetical protein AMS18_03130 [Gemmatimonas sp. SG8_17]|nr:MAG: hypothetical protein AMS18_03130 [Gemmatimonas sp. SG8_17]